MNGVRKIIASVLSGFIVFAAGPAVAVPNYVPISGAGSTWSEEAIKVWKASARDIYSMEVKYDGGGSSQGRNLFRDGTVDYAVSEIPYGLRDEGTDTYDRPPDRGFVYMPIVAGGTSLMYNLRVGGKRVTNLRLSGVNITKIFTGVITMWNDPEIKRDNPTLNLPARQIIPVVRSDGSGTTAQFTRWMAKRHGDLWNAYCGRVGRNVPCGMTSVYPTPRGSSNFLSQNGSDGVSGAVAGSNAEGAITYVEYSYPLNLDFPVAKVLNDAGYYVEPSAFNVAVALTKAEIDPVTLVQNLDNVYSYNDPRTYPLSSYSYMVLPTKYESTLAGASGPAKGYTLAKFSYYVVCEGQQAMAEIGFSPLPVNLVREALLRISQVPGAVDEQKNIANCNNPTFFPDDPSKNRLAIIAPLPRPCDKFGGPTDCSTTGQSTGTGQEAGPLDGPSGSASPEAGDGSNGTGRNGNSGGGYIDGIPTDLEADRGWRLRHTLMLLVGVLLLGIVAGPPLVTRLAPRSRPKPVVPSATASASAASLSPDAAPLDAVQARPDGVQARQGGRHVAAEDASEGPKEGWG